MLEIKPRLFWSLVALALAVGLGIIANPLIVNPPWLPDPVGDAILVVVGLAGLAWCIAVVVRRLCQSDRLPAVPSDTDADASGRPPETRKSADYPKVAVSFVFILAAWTALFWNRIAYPALFADDFFYLRVASDWQTTRDNLFVPSGGHIYAIPLLFGWGLCAATPTHAAHQALVYGGLALFVAVLPLLYLFLLRQWSCPFLALLGVTLFSLTRTHQEVVLWYSASIGVLLAFHLLLLSLLSLQRGGSEGHLGLTLSALCSALGPLCHLPGLLVGPISSIYLFSAPMHTETSRYRRWFRSAIPLLATATTAVCLAWLAGLNENALDSLSSPSRGVQYGVRCVVDKLLMGNLGLDPALAWPWSVYIGGFLLAAAATGALICRARDAQSVILGLALVLLPTLLICTFRTWLTYQEFVSRTRYQTFPQFGVTILIASAAAEIWPGFCSSRQMSWRHVGVIAILALALCALHAHRPGYIGG